MTGGGGREMRGRRDGRMERVMNNGQVLMFFSGSQ